MFDLVFIYWHIVCTCKRHYENESYSLTMHSDVTRYHKTQTVRTAKLKKPKATADLYTK